MKNFDKNLLWISNESYRYGRERITKAEAVTRLKRISLCNAKEVIEQIVPPLYRQVLDSERVHPQMLNACQRWAVGRRGLGLVGTTGIGKTRCMSKLVQRLMLDIKIQTQEPSDDPRFYVERPYEFCRIPWIEVVNDVDLAKIISASFDFTDGKKALLQLDRYKSAEVLFIDDLGQTKLTERVGSEYYKIVETRTGDEKPILFTSNYSGDALARKFLDVARGEAVVRRLREFCDVIFDDTSMKSAR